MIKERDPEQPRRRTEMSLAKGGTFQCTETQKNINNTKPVKRSETHHAGPAI